MSDLGHYLPLYAGYAAALLALAALLARRPGLWPRRDDDGIRRPWLELALLVPMLGLVVVIGTSLPGVSHPGLEFVRFAPLILFVIVVAWRGERRSLWVSPRRPLVHLGAGAGLAALGVVVFGAIGGVDPVSLAGAVFEGLRERDLRLPTLAVHVLFEDLAIVVLAARVLAVCRRVLVAGLIVAGLFALGHVPGLVDGGVRPVEIASLTLDTLLGTAVFVALARTRDMLWFWPLHLAMDLTQFA